MTEKELSNEIGGLVASLGLLGFSSPDSRRTQRGWPDWAIAGPGGIIFRELKSEEGVLTHEQNLIGRMMVKAGCNWDIWRPSDWLSGIVKRELLAIA